MAEINARYAETRAAFGRNTLKLLNQQRAAFVTAILLEVFRLFTVEGVVGVGASLPG
jgi:hypothetical protein